MFHEKKLQNKKPKYHSSIDHFSKRLPALEEIVTGSVDSSILKV